MAGVRSLLTPDPVEAIKFMMEQRNLTAKDLVPYIGRPNRVYEVLNRKRPLTMAMAWSCTRGWASRPSP